MTCELPPVDVALPFGVALKSCFHRRGVGGISKAKTWIVLSLPNEAIKDVVRQLWNCQQRHQN